MYKVGDRVMHRREGACLINEVVEMNVNRERKQYFLLVPLMDATAVVYVSTDMEKQNNIRPIIKLEEFETARAELEETPMDWIIDSKQRFGELNKRSRSFDFKELLLTMMCLKTQHKIKKLNNRDLELLTSINKMVSSELASLLNLDYNALIADEELYLLA